MKDAWLKQRKGGGSSEAHSPVTTAHCPKTNSVQDPKVNYHSLCAPQPPGQLHSSLTVCPTDGSPPGSLPPTPALGMQQALEVRTIFQVGTVIFSFLSTSLAFGVQRGCNDGLAAGAGS